MDSILYDMLLWLVVILFELLLYMRARYFLHMSQQLGYIPEEFLSWIKTRKDKAFGFSKDKSNLKKPLVMTPRAKRLFTTAMVLNGLVLILIPLWYYVHRPTPMGYVLLIAGLVFIGAYLFWQQSILMYISLYIILPVEKIIHRKFYREAQRKLRDLKKKGLTVVGITGSYGKTSTKMILHHILNAYLPTYSSPQSFNTPMGLSKIINNELTEEYAFFVAEMGARYQGEIKELVKLVEPDYGIITNVGPCHLETFGSLETILKTKFELADGVGEDCLVLNYDNDLIREEAHNRQLKAASVSSLVGVSSDVKVQPIEVTEEGSRFTITWGTEEIEVQTMLLGAHNMMNIAMAATVARKLGVESRVIQKAIETIPPVEHRLNIIKNPQGLIILDDAFNSNPAGARAAIDVLTSFQGGKKGIITPGMVELGDLQESENQALGKLIAQRLDFSIFVGKKITKPLQNGVEEIANPKHDSYVVETLEEATQLLTQLVGAGDVVLFENDLTDIY